MKNINRKAAVRIGFVSVILAIVTGFFAWYTSKENFEKSIISLAYEEAEKLSVLEGNNWNETSPDVLARHLTGGLFDIAELYDGLGNKLAESMTPTGMSIEEKIPGHDFVNDNKAIYQSYNLPDDIWVIRVFVPLQDKQIQHPGLQQGYFEGVRLIPDWQKKEIYYDSFFAAFLVSFAAIICGVLIYPIVVHLTRENQNQAKEVLDSHISMMEALGRAIAKRDSDTGTHNYKVAWIAALIGEKAGLKSSQMQSLIAGSFLHDVGKIGITDRILLKPGKLTDEEFDIMRTHVVQGEEIVRGMGWLSGAHEIVSAHHEKYDGSGYPRHLKGEEIPLSARIFAIADVFDALSSRRPYKEAMPYATVMEILKKDTGTHFDSTLMAYFLPMAHDIYHQLDGIKETEARNLLQEKVREHFFV